MAHKLSYWRIELKPIRNCAYLSAASLSLSRARRAAALNAQMAEAAERKLGKMSLRTVQAFLRRARARISAL
jgi:hypothetical protein